MKLDDFLKPKKVRCIIGSSHSCLTAGKLYEVIGATYGRLKIHNDNGGNSWYDMNCFELVPNQAENPLENTELTPEFETETSKPNFEVGDKVYFGTSYDIKNISEVGNDNDVQFVGEIGWASGDCCCHATQENYEMLCNLYPHIKFEQPPKPLTGSDLARAMLDKGWKYVPCYISDSSDTHALERQTRNAAVIIGTHKDHPSFFIYGSGKSFIYHAVPFDPRTGEPLTQAVLDE